MQPLYAILENNFCFTFFQLVPYAAFILAATYTLKRFFFYADIADKLESVGFNFLIRSELEKVLIFKREKKDWVETNISDFIKTKTMRSKRFFNRLPHVFEVSYGFAIFFLTIVVYWAFLQPYLKELIALFVSRLIQCGKSQQ